MKHQMKCEYIREECTHHECVHCFPLKSPTQHTTYIFVSWLRVRSKERLCVHKPYSTAHQTGFIVRINCVRTRQEISKHISIAYIYVVLSYAHTCSNCLSFTMPGYKLYIYIYIWYMLCAFKPYIIWFKGTQHPITHSTTVTRYC